MTLRHMMNFDNVLFLQFQGYCWQSDLVNFRDSCAISDPRNEVLYLTGNYYSSYSKKVSQYGPQGFLADLPELITGRAYHACAGFYDGSDNFLLLVAGGWNYDGRSTLLNRLIYSYIKDFLSSTEIFGVGVSSEWTEISPLPNRLYDPRATKVDNREIFLTGRDICSDIRPINFCIL